MAANHAHTAPTHGRAFAIAIGVNLAFSGVEAGYGVVAGSLSLIADAAHNLSDVLGLLLAWGATVLAARPATEYRTYGLRKASILGALGSALLLLFALGGMAWEAIARVSHPQPVQGLTVMVVAGFGVLVNAFSALLFLSGQRKDLNLRGAFLHLAADAAVSIGVLIAGAVILFTGWLLIDPLMSLVVAAVVLVSTWSLLQESLDLALDAVPKGIDVPAIRAFLLEQAGVDALHDLHVWPLSTTETALSVHLVVSDVETLVALPLQLQRPLQQQFQIDHATLQTELADAADCALDREQCKS